MDVGLLLALPQQIEVTSVEVTDNGLTLSVTSTQDLVCCPVCLTPAKRVHSHYLRTVADLPCVGQEVRFLLTVRKFFCKEASCHRKIFVERLLPFLKAWARVTTRLYETLQNIGLATSGMLGARLTDRMGIDTSRNTILRRIMALPSEPVESVVEVGIDDFSFRRGRKFGSIIVDMQSHEVIDVLPDRTAETTKTWMQKHPEIERVSRDGSSEFALGIREGAPQALQNADRFHLLDNLLDDVELTLARCRGEIRSKTLSHQRQNTVAEELERVSIGNWQPAPKPNEERERLARRAQRYDRYQQVIELHQGGFAQTEIAARVGLSRRTIRQWIENDGFPEHKSWKRGSIFDQYAPYVLSRWEAGEHNGMTLFKEIRGQGFTGSFEMVYSFLRPLRKNKLIIQKAELPDAPLQDFTAKDAVWLAWF